ncbi:Gag polyprotein [Elysia marginata]|uniref:Gag polyprotein n=1 Tax=Elysia marginata TaxID=1093978 RepID=A0AAV4JQR7_9GAST|nr:Gag polyprotein [Elysia marginata]
MLYLIFLPFRIREGELSAGLRWRKWFQKFDNLITALDIINEDRKKALLIHYGGDEILDLVHTFPEEKKNTYEALKTALETYFTPRVNTTFEIFKLRKMKQLATENVNQFHVRLRTQAAHYSFTDVDREILAQLIEGVNSSKLRKKALRDRLTLTQFLSEARNEKLTEAQARKIERTDQAIHVPSLTKQRRALRFISNLHQRQLNQSRTIQGYAGIVEVFIRLRNQSIAPLEGRYARHAKGQTTLQEFADRN